MSVLFEPVAYGHLAAGNRLVRSATHEGMADADGNATPELEETLAHLAEGGVGMVISGHAFVLPEGRASRLQLGIESQDRVAGIARLARKVQEHGAKFVLQLAHAGARSDTEETGLPAKGPSEGAVGTEGTGAMNQAEIERTIAGFVSAASRAKAAGCDGVQVHAAHGYLLSSFLTPAFNRRSDDWGGSLENRARLLLTIVEEIRNFCGADFPVLVKLNAADFIDGGMTAEEMRRVSEWLKEVGVSAIEMSGGTPVSGDLNPIRMKDPTVWYEAMAEAFRKAVSLPLILVGGIRDLETATRLLEEDIADGIALSRPLIREPDLPRKWADQTATGSRCTSCNRCFLPIRKGEGVCCLKDRRARS